MDEQDVANYNEIVRVMASSGLPDLAQLESMGWKWTVEMTDLSISPITPESARLPWPSNPLMRSWQVTYSVRLRLDKTNQRPKS